MFRLFQSCILLHKHLKMSINFIIFDYCISLFYDNGQLTLLVLVGWILKLRIEMLLQINGRRIFFRSQAELSCVNSKMTYIIQFSVYEYIQYEKDKVCNIVRSIWVENV